MANAGDCFGCTCTFATGCKGERVRRDQEQRRQIKPRERVITARKPGPMRDVARELRESRIASGAKWYRTKLMSGK